MIWKIEPKKPFEEQIKEQFGPSKRKKSDIHAHVSERLQLKVRAIAEIEESSMSSTIRNLVMKGMAQYRKEKSAEKLEELRDKIEEIKGDNE